MVCNNVTVLATGLLGTDVGGAPSKNPAHRSSATPHGETNSRIHPLGETANAPTKDGRASGEPPFIKHPFVAFFCYRLELQYLLRCRRKGCLQVIPCPLDLDPDFFPSLKSPKIDAQRSILCLPHCLFRKLNVHGCCLLQVPRQFARIPLHGSEDAWSHNFVHCAIRPQHSDASGSADRR